MFHFYLFKSVLRRKVSLMQASKYVRRLIFSDEISSWPFDKQTFRISVKHFALTSVCSVIKLKANDNALKRLPRKIKMEDRVK